METGLGSATILPFQHSSNNFVTACPPLLNTMQVRLKDLAMCTMAPYLVQGAMGAGAGFLADRLLASGHPVRRVREGQAGGRMGAMDVSAGA